MDNTQLTTAMREATEDLEPQDDFAAAVLRGGRRRRTRGRVAIGAAITGAVAAAVVAAVAVPARLSAPPPGEQHDGPKQEQLLARSGGDLVHDRDTVRLATTAWQDSVDTTYVNEFGYLSHRLGEPHVYWAGTTPAGAAAVITQAAVLPASDNVEASDRGQRVVAVGLLVTSPGAKRELELVGVQFDGDHNGYGGYFVFPDNRTVLGIEPEAGLALFVSPNTAIGAGGRSRRHWTELPGHDGVSYTQLPEPANPRNIRLAVSQAGGDPNAGEQKLGAHLPLLSAVDYIAEREGVDVDNGLPWPARDMTVGDETTLPRTPLDLFGTALRESGLLDSASFDEEELGAHWQVVAGMADGRTMIVGPYQELDNPAYLFTVLVRAGGAVEKVARGPAVDPDAVLPVRVRLPGGQGWVVAAQGHQLTHRTGGAWSAPVADAALVPDATTQVRVDGQAVDLPR